MRTKLDKSLWLILLLLLIGVMARLWQFGRIPVSLNRDEAALGYNAWSIWHYGLDEWGERYPLMFKSFGDYKLPGYIYLLAPLTGLLGASDAVIRLPSLLGGLGLLAATGWWVYLLFGKKKVGVIVSVLAGLSPFTLFYSRMAYEANIGLLLVILSLCLLSIKKMRIRRFWLSLTYLLACLTYNTPLLLAPVFILYIWTLKFEVKRRVLDSLVIGVVGVGAALLLLPVISQKSSITIFSDPALILSQQEAYSKATSLIEKARVHWTVFYTRELLIRVSETLSPQFLTIAGGKNPWHTVPGTGHIHWVVYAAAFAGLLKALWKLRKQVEVVPLLVLTAGSLLPAVTTVDAPHATRSLLFMICLLVWASWFINRYKRAVWIFCLIVLGEFSLYAYNYFVRFPKAEQQEWSVGFAQSMETALAESGEKTIYIAPEMGVMDDLVSRQTYIFALLYSRTPAEEFTRTAQYLPPDPAGIIRVSRFGRFDLATPIADIPTGSDVIWRTNEGAYYYEKK